MINVGDKVGFKFKKNAYGATIAAGGLVTRCTMNEQGVPGVFQDLQTWCEECITELGGEYVQRFASSRRVKHEPTGRSFSQLKELMGTKQGNARPCQCAEAVAQRRRVLELEQQVRELETAAVKAIPVQVLDADNPFLLKF